MTIVNSLGDTSLIRALGGLAVDPPTELAVRVFAQWVRVPGPLGPLFVAFTDRGISYVRLAEVVDDDAHRFAEDVRDRLSRPVRPADRPPPGLLAALRTGRTRNLAFDLRGQSKFEQAVLTKTLEIPPGETRPYSWVAREIGRPAAVRAAGSALGRNPIPILIPCHRVVRSDGEPGNYAFGPQRKQALLRAEDVDLDETRRLAASHVHYLASDTTGVVCYPTCYHARRISAAHRVGFRTVERAVAAGYRPCQHCRPALATTA
jgi:O-6-methylguanine DNA methyltransferase